MKDGLSAIFGRASRKGVVIAVALLVVGFVAAIVASGALHSVGSFASGLAGSNAQGNEYTARTHTGYSTGSNDGLATGYAANVGVFNPADTSVPAPILSVASVSSKLIANGSNVVLSLTALYANVTGANISCPNGTVLTLPIASGSNATFDGSGAIGHYDILFFAQGTGGIATASTYLDIVAGVPLNVLVLGPDGNGTTSSVSVINGTNQVASGSSPNGTFMLPVPPIVAALQAIAQSGSLIITLQGVDLTDDGAFSLDRHTTIGGYLITYGVETTFNFSSATVNISYEGTGYSDEARLRLYKCDPYLFMNRTCAGTWNDVTAGAMQDSVHHRFAYQTTGFSGFSVKELPVAPGGSGGSGGGGGTLLSEMHVTVQKSCDERMLRASVTYGGIPLVDARVAAETKEGAPVGETITDTEGKARLVLADGQYYLTFSHDGFSTQHGFLNLNCSGSDPVEAVPTPNVTQPVPEAQKNESGPQSPDPTNIKTDGSDETGQGEWIIAQNETNTTISDEGSAAAHEDMATPQEQEATQLEEAEKKGLFARIFPWLLPLIILIPIAATIARRRNKTPKKKENKEEKTVAATGQKQAAQTGTTQAGPKDALQGIPAAPIALDASLDAQRLDTAPTSQENATAPATQYQHPGWDTTASPVIAPVNEEVLSFFEPVEENPDESAKEQRPVQQNAPQGLPVQTITPTPNTVPENQPSPLRQLDESQWFTLADKRKLKSIPELVKELPEMQDSLFFAHVTSDRNDFATWAYHAVGDTTLAAQIGPIKSKAELLRVLIDHIHSVSEQLARGAASGDAKQGAFLDALVEHYTTLGKKEAA